MRSGSGRVELFDLDRSPECLGVRGAGQIRSPERPTATVAELAAAVEACTERYRLALLLAAWCQLRRGEVLALQRRHVAVVPGVVRVEKAWVVSSEGKTILDDPKTEKGTRTLSVPTNVLPLLAFHLERFTGPEPDAWLFPGKGDKPITPRTLNCLWEQASSAVGRPDLRLHDFRHSGLTWAAATGASVAKLMHRGGHASPTAALRYQHASADRDAVIAAALAELASNKKVCLLGADRQSDRARCRCEGHPCGFQGSHIAPLNWGIPSSPSTAARHHPPPSGPRAKGVASAQGYQG